LEYSYLELVESRTILPSLILDCCTIYCTTEGARRKLIWNWSCHIVANNFLSMYE